MNLTCPRCHATLAIADERVPVNGAWAKCPKCQERFFIKANPVLVDQNKEEERTAPLRGRDQASQKLLDRLKKNKVKEAETSLDAPDDQTILVTVFPEAVINQQLYILFMVMAVVVLIVILIMGFSAAGLNREQPSPTVQAYLVIPEYGAQSLKTDLITLRSALHSRRLTRRVVTYQSPETRVFKYALARLAPDLCQEIVRVSIWTNDPYRQFTAKADCLEEGWSPPVMEVVWKKGKAIITFTDHPDQLEVDLKRERTPPKPATAETNPG